MDRMLPSRIAVAQIGARMHYGVPRILANSGLLDRLYTDIYGGKGLGRWLSMCSGFGLKNHKKIKGRLAEGVPIDRVIALDWLGLAYRMLRSVAHGADSALRAHLWMGQKFCSSVAPLLDSGLGGVYVFNSAGLEILEKCSELGILGVMEQTIAPRQIEERLISEENVKWPGWESWKSKSSLCDAYDERVREEWLSADVIVCGSEFVRDGIKSVLGSADKCSVVPYGVDEGVIGRRRLRDASVSRPLRALFVGTVGLRKGAPYLAAAARALRGQVEFRVVGECQLLPRGVRELRDVVDLRGPIPRSEIDSEYSWADLLVLPSLLEGSATVTYEALRLGLPVVTTPNAGSPVRDGVDGVIVPAGEVSGFVNALLSFKEHPDRLRAFSEAALMRGEELSIAGYSERLCDLLARSVMLR